MCPLFGVRRWPLFGGSKCIGIMGRSNGGSATVRSRGGVRSMEGPSSEVLLYMYIHVHVHTVCTSSHGSSHGLGWVGHWQNGAYVPQDSWHPL